MAMLEVTGLSVSYRGLGTVTQAVSDMSFEVGRGEVVGVVGESGSGKSTATLAVLGLTKHGGSIDAGSVRFDGVEMLGAPEDQWRRVRGARIGLITQNPRGALSPVSPIGAQIADLYRTHQPEATKDEARTRAMELLTTVGINDPERRLEAFPHELSGGMAQRALIAMGLACDPELLIADEPTSGLDVTVQAQVLDDLRRAASETGSSLLLVTQDLGIVANYCDRVYLMHAGEVLEQATTKTVFATPRSPATLALLAAQRRLAADAVRLAGFPVDGSRLPASACWLAPRCPFAEKGAGCLTAHPELVEFEAGHFARCHRGDAVRNAALDLLAVAPSPSDPVEKEHA